MELSIIWRALDHGIIAGLMVAKTIELAKACISDSVGIPAADIEIVDVEEIECVYVN